MDLRDETSQIVCALFGSEDRERSHRILLEMLQSGELEPDQWMASCVPGEQFTLLPAAIERGWTELAMYLINRRVKLDRKTDGRTPLMLACENRNHDLVEALITAGADLNLKSSKDDEGGGHMTALMEAAEKGDLWAVRRLVKAGADAKIATPRNQTAIFFALTNNKSEAEREIVEELMAAGCPLLGNELHYPIYRREAEITKLLIESSCSLNELFVHNDSMGPGKGHTPLTCAVETNLKDQIAIGALGANRKDASVAEKQQEIVRMLLAAGADPNFACTRGKGFTPLMLAVMDKNLKLAEMLIAAGADPELVPPKSLQESPLALARKGKLEDFIQLFFSSQRSN